MLKIVCALFFGLLIGFWLGTHQTPIQIEEKHESCVTQCTNAVLLVQTLWPSARIPLTALTIVPKTEEACTNICIAKQVKDFVL